MATQATLDDMIAALMGMGFELKDAQDALQFGKVSTEEAVEWILAGKPGYAPMATSASAAPTLKLGQAQNSSLPNLNPDTRAPFSKPLPVPDDTTSRPSPPAEGEPSLADIEMEKQVVSRLHLTEEKAISRHKFEEKERMEARKQAQHEKMQAKRDRERALKEIAEDREAKKMMKVHSSASASPSQVPVAPSSSSTAAASTSNGARRSASSSSASDNPLCSVQIRLPSGKMLRKRLDKTLLLGQLWKEILEEAERETEGYSGFMQPFPRREFGASEMNKSLEQLGLVPTGSLVLKKIEVEDSMQPAPLPEPAQEPTPPAPVERGGGDEDEDEDNVMDESTGMGRWRPVDGEENDEEAERLNHQWGRGRAMHNDDPDQGNEAQPEPAPAPLRQLLDQMPPGHHPMGRHGAAGNHFWGRGRALEGPAADEHESDDDNNLIGDDDEDDDDDDMMAMHGGGGGFGPPRQGGIQGFGQHGRGGGGGLGGWFGAMPGGPFVGVGMRLVPEGAPRAEDHNNRQAADLAAEAARQRQARPAEPAQPSAPLPPTPAYPEVTPLKEACFHHVVSRITDPRDPLRSLGRMPHELAEQVLNYLLQNKLLDPKTMKIFMNCFLNRLVLDAYIYTTNELLYTIRLLPSLQTLSLHSCPLINDQGIKHIESLRNLRVLNLGLCKQITNKSLAIIAGLSNLQTLSLEETGVTDSGLAKYFATKPCLKNLNLSRTAITNDIFLHLTQLQQLQKLYIEDTKVTSLTGIESLTQLTALNIASTPIATECLLSLAAHPSLTHLNLSHTDQMVGDMALQYVSGLKLRSLSLPDRHSVTSNGLTHITGFMLHTLDLTNYIHVGDDGMQHVGKIVSLNVLMLSNTKVTDEGILYLSGLTRLRILYLDRTVVSDVGLSVVRSFKKLQELSLSTTSVTNSFLTQGILHDCLELTKLNLSRTNIGDRGVERLKLPYLSLLNLDCTRVHPPIVDVIKRNCPCIKMVTTANLAPVMEEEEEMEENA